MCCRHRTTKVVWTAPRDGLFVADVIHDSAAGNQEEILLSWRAEQANWYKNLIKLPEDVYVQIGLRRVHAHAEVIKDPQELKRILKRFVVESPNAARRLLGWDPEQDDPATSDFSLMIEKVLTVRFAEC